MFFKKKPQARNIKMPANLNRKQQREIKAVVERAKKDNGIPQTAQQSIPCLLYTSSKELWLAEDMTFYVVSCMSTITMDK